MRWRDSDPGILWLYVVGRVRRRWDAWGPVALWLYVVGLLAFMGLRSLGQSLGWPTALLGTLDTATLLYLLPSVPVVMYVVLAGLVRAVWWLFVALWHVRPRPLGPFVTGAFVLAWVGVFVWVAPRVSRDSGQFDFAFASLLLLASAYRIRSRLPRRRRDAGEPEDAAN